MFYWITTIHFWLFYLSLILKGFNVTQEQDLLRSEHEVNHQSYKQKGIPLLTYLLEEHVDLEEVYYLLLSLLIKSNSTGLLFIFLLTFFLWFRLKLLKECPEMLEQQINTCYIFYLEIITLLVLQLTLIFFWYIRNDIFCAFSILGMAAGLKLDIRTLHLIFWPPASAERIRDEKLVQLYCLDIVHVLFHMIRRLMSEPVVNLLLFYQLIYLWIFTQYSLSNSNELLSMRIIPSLPNTYKGAYGISID